MKAVTLDEAIRERLAERRREREEAEAREQARLEEIARQEAQIERLMPVWLADNEGIQTEATEWLAQALVTGPDAPTQHFRVQWQDSESEAFVDYGGTVRLDDDRVVLPESASAARDEWKSRHNGVTRAFDRFVDAVVYARGIQMDA